MLTSVFVAAFFAGIVAFPSGGRGADSPVALPPAPLRPDSDSGPTKVSIGIWVGDITQVDSVSQTFSSNFIVVLRWRDSLLVHNESGPKRFELDDIWHPHLIAVNQAGSVELTMPEIAEVAPDGLVICRQRYVGSFAQSLDLRAFPFDEDTFQVHFAVAGYRPEEIEFVPDSTMVAAGFPTGTGINKNLTVPNWKVNTITSSSMPYTVVPGLEVAGYALKFDAARDGRHFVLKVIVPLILIVMMSWAVFWIEPADANSQLAVAVTAMLTLIAFRFAVDSDIPNLPYLTRLDMFILASTVLVFFSLLEVMVTNKLANRDRVSEARKIDRASRVVFPTVFAILTAVIFFR